MPQTPQSTPNTLDNDGTSTTQKNPRPKTSPTDVTSPDFPPEGYKSGHIFIRQKHEANRFKIKATNGKFYDYEGPPKEGEHLRRLAPVTFRSSPYGTRAEEVSEIKKNLNALKLNPLEGKLTLFDQGRGYGEISVTRIDGTFDKSPFKFFTRNFNDPDTQLPKVGAHILFKTDFARSSRLDKQGRNVSDQHFVNIVEVTHNTLSLRTYDKNIINPLLLQIIRSSFHITLEVGTEAVHSTFNSLTALQALHLDNESIPHIIEQMHTSVQTHCHQHKHTKITDPPTPATNDHTLDTETKTNTPSDSSPDSTHPLTPEQHALKQARQLRHTLNKNQPINILINPQAWQEKDTADKWVRHLNFTLSSHHTFSSKIGSIYLIEHADINTTPDSIIHSNPQIISRPIHSHLPNHVHRIHYIDAPSHEGEWNDGKIEFARARNYHKYIIHEFRASPAEYIPTIKLMLTSGMEEDCQTTHHRPRWAPPPPHKSQFTTQPMIPHAPLHHNRH